VLSFVVHYCPFWAICLALGNCAIAQEPTKQPALADKYADAPQSARAILTALKKLEIKIEIGISYQAYKTEIENVYPEIRLFLDSRESKKFPELCFLLSNVGDSICSLGTSGRNHSLEMVESSIG